MKITPLDIRRKEFKRSMRGYADEEVDIFLDEVADEFERLFQENMELKDRAQRMDEQIAGHAQLRDALEKTLISAQLQAEELRANAHKESELILRDAEMKARGIVNDSYGETQKTQQSLVQLKLLEEDFRFKFRSLLEGYLRLLNQAPLAGSNAEGAGAAAPAPEAGVEATAPAGGAQVEGTAEQAWSEEWPTLDQLQPVPVAQPAPAEAVLTAPGADTAQPAIAWTPVRQAPAPIQDTTESSTLETAGLEEPAGISLTAEPALVDEGRAFLAPEAGAPPFELPVPVGTAPPADQMQEPADDQSARGFFFGRRLEDIDDTFAGDDATKKDNTRDFEW